MSTVTHEMAERNIPLESQFKPPDSSLVHVYDVSSVLHSLIKEVALEPMFQNCFLLVVRCSIVKYHFTYSAMSYKPRERPTVIQL